MEDQSWLAQMENPFHVSHAQIVSLVQKIRNGVSCRTSAVSPYFPLSHLQINQDFCQRLVLIR